MSCFLRNVGWCLPLILLGVALLDPSDAVAQIQSAGVYVDAEGVLRKQTYNDPTGQLTRQRMAAARESLDPQVANQSPLRKVSLNRLERLLGQIIAENRSIPEEMRHLAGMTRVRYVFYYPDTQDIVLAGPAEGWMTDVSGRTVGLSSGMPLVELQDLIVALRAYPPGGEEGPVIGCSIDPTQEGLSRMQEFLARVGRTATPGDTEFIVEGLRSSLGLQTVRVLGVQPNTHFAMVMVEADYRMKLIGIGLEQPPIKLASYVERANPAQVARNAMQRWYFTPDYQCVRLSDDQLAMELVGDGVRLIGEDELVTEQGARRTAGSVDRASQAFVQGFTRQYGQLAARSPVYAQLRNLIDLAVAAAHIQKQDYYAQADWQAATFMDEAAYPVETYNVPQQVETAVTSIWKGNRLMTPVGGGVNVQAFIALESENLLEDEKGEVGQLRLNTPIELADGQWWWD